MKAKRFRKMRETEILRKYWQDEWHFKADGRLLIRVKRTGKWIVIEEIDHGPRA